MLSVSSRRLSSLNRERATELHVDRCNAAIPPSFPPSRTHRRNLQLKGVPNMRVIGLIVAVVLATVGNLPAEPVLYHPADQHQHHHTEAVATTAHGHADHHVQGCRADTGCLHQQPCGNIDGFPGKCGYHGPGCCASLWDNYCQERRPCFGGKLSRRGLHLPVGCKDQGCCDRPLLQPCFTKPLLPTGLGLHFGSASCDAAESCDEPQCDTGCDVQDLSHIRPTYRDAEPASQPLPHNSVPEATSDPSARKGFFPFSLRLPARGPSDASAKSASRRSRFSL